MDEIESGRGWRRRRGVLTAAAICGVAMVVAVAPATAEMTFDSKIRLKNAAPAFHGKVKSDNQICIENRKVRLFREKTGEDKVLGKTRTDFEGKWTILKEPKSGVYYAKVNQGGSASLAIVCNPDVSKKIVID